MITDRAQATHADWVLAVTKTYDSESATQWFENAVGPATRLAVIQNGVEQVERFAHYVDRSRIVPVMIDCRRTGCRPDGDAERAGQDRSCRPGRNGADFVALFEKTKIDAQVTDGFHDRGLEEALPEQRGRGLRCAQGARAHRPSRRRRGHHARDRARVRRGGRAEGARIDDSMPDDIVARTRRAPRDSTNSMLVDRADRKMEIDARNGVIVRSAASTASTRR